ncbi:MAG: M20 family metallopeptidase [Ruminococcaceae bacterium]|nr:M20 family metallopeptidase [Oscillospiraceae bacterium]
MAFAKEERRMINRQLDEKATAWLAAHREKILEMWMDLVRIPSVQAPAEPGAPFGAACAAALERSASHLAALGLPVVHRRADGYAFADVGEGAQCVGLFGHSDVVPVGEGWLYTKPFEPIVRDGRLIGRGASDNKSGIMASWCVAAMLKALDVPLRNRLRVFVGSNEESGMKDIEAYVKHEEMPAVSLVPDSSYPCGLGEKGILRMWVKCEIPFAAVRSMEGGDAFNIVLDQLDAVLEPNDALAAELRERCAGDGRYSVEIAADSSILLQSRGVAKHAASPEDSVNATWLMATLLSSCEALPQSDRQILSVVADYLQDPHGKALGIAHEDEIFGHLTAANGMVALEEGYLKLSLDVRYGTSLAPEVLEEGLCRAWQEKGFAVSYLENRGGYVADPTSPVPGVLKAVVEELAGKEMNCYRMRGGTYGRYLKNAFPVGTALFHADRQPIPAMPAGHGGAHQRDEAADIEGFFLGVRVLLQCVLAVDGLLD